MEEKKRAEKKGMSGISRRSFVKGSAALVGAAAAGVAFPAVITHAAPKPIRIGGLMDMTGGLYSFGIGQHRSIEAAVKAVNQAGGISGRPVEYVMEDAATNVQTGIRKMRKLVMQDSCDFVQVSTDSGVGVAVAPIAKELNTVLFQAGTALALTGDKGNRYCFRTINNARQSSIAMSKVALEMMGKRFYGLGADFEWGRSVVEEMKRIMTPRGGTLVGEEYSPIGTEDFIPYLNKIPQNVELIIAGYFTDDILKLVKQAHEKGLLKNMWIVGGAMPTGIGPKDFGPGGDRVWFTAYGFHRMIDIPENMRNWNRAFRKAIQMDDDGRYTDIKEMGAPSYCWVGWENVYWLKRAIEKSGWQSKADNLKFITALEGMSVAAGPDFITGGKTMRAQDHQVFTDQSIVKIEKGDFVLKAVVKGSDLNYEATADYTKEKIG
jgi:branched-chain amino acid transport system substrate-binding protein